MKTLFAALFRRVPSRVLRWGLFLANAKFNHGAVGIFEDSNRRVLLLRHVFRKNYPWGFPSGFVAVGEDAATAAVRELKEETGLTATVTAVGATTLVAPRHLETVVYGYVAVPEPLTISHEIFEARWVTRDQIPEDIAAGLPRGQLPLLGSTSRRDDDEG